MLLHTTAIPIIIDPEKEQLRSQVQVLSVEAQSLRNTNFDLGVRCSNLEVFLTAAESEKSLLSTRIAAQDAVIRNNQIEMRMLNDRLHVMTLHNKGLLIDQQSADHALQTLSAYSNALIEELQLNEMERIKLHNHQHELLHEVNVLVDENDELRTKTLSRLLTQNSSLELELKVKQLRAEDAGALFEHYRREHEKLLENWGAASRMFNEERTRLQRTIDDLAARLKEAETTIATMDKEMKILTADYDKLQAKLVPCMNENDSLKERLTVIENRRDPSSRVQSSLDRAANMYREKLSSDKPQWERHVRNIMDIRRKTGAWTQPMEDMMNRTIPKYLARGVSERLELLEFVEEIWKTHSAEEPMTQYLRKNGCS
mmetsp:Transcript_2440/g.6647  ORF Transcript_2440/g.6647 Transcript_2440/m.6647 type:complete len:372 (+) Transcript_2440:3-1118(+)